MRRDPSPIAAVSVPGHVERLGLERDAGAIFDAVPVGLVEVGADGDVLLWNRAAEALLGRCAADAVGRALATIEPEIAQRLDQAAPRDGDAGTASVDAARPGRFGAQHVSVSIRRIGTPEGDGSLLLALEDVSGRLPESERLHDGTTGSAGAFEAAPVAIWETDLTGRVLRANPATEHLMGWAQSELIGARPPWDDDEPAPAMGTERLVWRSRKDGAPICLALSAAPALAPSGLASVITVGRDITSETRAREEQLAVAAQHRAVVDSMSDALAVLEPDEDGTFRFTFVNDRYLRLTGNERERVLGRTIADVLQPERAPRVSENLALCASTGRELRHELHWDNLNGRTVDALRRLTPVLDEHGRCRRVICVLTDVTDGRRAEAALRFQAHLLDELPLAVVASDAGGRVTHWNAYAEELTGLTAETLLGQRLPRALATGGHDDVVEAVRAGARCRDEIEIVHTSGAVVPVDLRVLPLPDHADGHGGGMLFVGADLREQREAQAALAESNARIELILDRVTDAFVSLDAEGRVTRVNAEAAKLLRRNDSVVGRHLHDVLADAGGSVLESEFRRAAADGVPVFFEEFYPSLDSWFSIHAYPASDGLSVFFQDVTERRRAEEEIAHLAYNDGLTGLPNRTRFREELELALARAGETADAVAVLYVDLDDFKLVNDSLGHDVGDELLQRLASRLRRVSRDEDLLARQGGDEFLMLVSELDQGDAGSHALELASRLESALAEPFVLGGVELLASASVGVSLYPRDATDPDSLLKHADAAMYAAKRAGRGCARLYEADGQDPLAQLSQVGRLRKAIERSEFVLHWQPIVDLANGTVSAAEALVRWEDPDRGLVLPGDFIPLAEDTGLIEGLGERVIEEFCRQSATWQRQGLDLSTSFNLSLRQLWQPNVARRLLQAIESAGLDPRRVVVEVTESAAMTDAERALRIFRDLREGGVRLALDDFGTGYSSLGRLAALPVDAVKIDRSFVQAALGEPNAATLVEVLLQLARALDLNAVAEGIETAAQLEFLLARGCPTGQGFHLGRPAPAEDLARRLLAPRAA